MNSIISRLCFLIAVGMLFLPRPAGAQNSATTLTLQTLLNGMQSNYEFLKYQKSLVDEKQAHNKTVAFERLPNLKTAYEINVGSDNSIPGSYYTYGLIPTVNGGTRIAENLNPEAGSIAVAGLEWEAVNFGGYKSRLDVARSELDVQKNAYGKSENDLFGIASYLYLELLQQYQLTVIQQDNVSRLEQLKRSIDALVVSGVRPGVDSTVASAELSKSKIILLQARKDFVQLQQKLANLSGITADLIIPDTSSAGKLTVEGLAWTLTSPVDTAHHPTINFYNSLYRLSQFKYKADKNSYYPKIMLNASVWSRASSVSYNDKYDAGMVSGFVPSRWNYLTAISLSYDIFNIARKRLKMGEDKYETEASLHRLNDEKGKLQSVISEMNTEKDFQINRLNETQRQLNAASAAYLQQVSLYQSGLSSFLDVSTTLNYYIQARRDFVNSRVGVMHSVIDYALATNSFNSLLQTLKF